MFRRELYRRCLSAVTTCTLILFGSLMVQAQTSVFTYQGRLTDANAPANGLYDFEFHLYDESSAQIGPALTREDVQVTNGVFTVTLDFGATAFDGAARSLEIGVRPGTSTDAFTALAPRQSIHSTPYSLRTLSAARADAADNAAMTADSEKLGGVAAGQYVKTDDPRLLAGGGPPAPGSPNYIQNTTTQQSAAFNVSGNGTVGGTFSGQIVSAATQFNIGSNRVLRATEQFTSLGIGAGATPGVVGNSFFGHDAGAATTKGGNSFFGTGAGKANQTGMNNAFFGASAGLKNVDGVNNSFFGALAGQNTTGAGNSFFGERAGVNNQAGKSNTIVGLGAGASNTTEDGNTFIGASANGAAGIGNATAIGVNAKVTRSNSLVLGAVDAYVGIGVTAPKMRLEVNGNIYLSTAGKGVILKSSDGKTCRFLTVNDQGEVVVPIITCP